LDALSKALKNFESGYGYSTPLSIDVQIGDGHQRPRYPTGRWRILEMDLWDREALDLVTPAFIEFSPDHTGCFGFMACSGWIDWRVAVEGRPGVDFSWEGTDEGDQVSGRGWAVFQDDGLVVGHLYFHLGDESSFIAGRNGS
jgi:hypothetical protein